MESLNKRTEQKELTRAKILQTALQLFSIQGIAQTSTAVIAQNAGIAHGTLFSHFLTQEDLILQVVEEFGTRLNLELHKLSIENQPLKILLQNHLKGLEKDEMFYSKLILEAGSLPAQARAVLTGIQTTVAIHLQPALVQASQKKLPAQFLFNLWIGIVHHYLINAELFTPEKSVLHEKGPELIRNFLKLISKE